VLALRPDVVVLATGSVPRWPAWAANAPTPVIDEDDVVANTLQPEGPGKVVMLVDDEGAFVAATAAEALASSDWSVRIATSFTSVAARVEVSTVYPVSPAPAQQPADTRTPSVRSQRRARPWGVPAPDVFDQVAVPDRRGDH
jgi:hypothetical protein